MSSESDSKRANHDSDPSSISAQMISDIVESELVVADLTDLNANVFYELGVRHCTKKPCVQIARIGTSLPFDNFDQRTIFCDVGDWQDMERCRNALSASVKRIEGADYAPINPFTQYEIRNSLINSGDAEKITISQMQDQLSMMHSRILELERRKIDKMTRYYLPEFKNRLNSGALENEVFGAEGATKEYIDRKEATNRAVARILLQRSSKQK